jgi:hypothetical protein
MESLTINGVTFNIGDTVAYNDKAREEAEEQDWIGWGFITEDDLNKEHKVIGFSHDTNVSGEHNVILDHEDGETATEWLRIVKKVDDEHNGIQ